jgi:hypothetical protein
MPAPGSESPTEPDSDYTNHGDSIQQTVLGHSVVLIGYNDSPVVWNNINPGWIAYYCPTLGARQSPQNFFWNTFWGGDFLFSAPWKLFTTCPQNVCANSKFVVGMNTWYSAPWKIAVPNQNNVYPVDTSIATISVPAGFSLPNNDPVKDIYQWIKDAGDYTPPQIIILWIPGIPPGSGHFIIIVLPRILWTVKAPGAAGAANIKVDAKGVLHKCTSTSYPGPAGYIDTIGGRTTLAVNVVPLLAANPGFDLHGPTYWQSSTGNGIWYSPSPPEAGQTTNIFAEVHNYGTSPTSGGTVNFYRGNPTLTQSANSTNWTYLGSQTLPIINPGDSATVGPLPVTFPPANSYGESYFTIFAKINYTDDPGTTGWFLEDDNVTCENYRTAQGTIGVPETLTFLVENPESRSYYFAVGIDKSQLPSGWTAQLSAPLDSDPPLIPSGGTLPVKLIVTPSSAGAGKVDMMGYLIDTTGTIKRITGGLTFRVNVPGDGLDIDSTLVHSVGNHGTLVNTTTFRVYSTGTTTLYGITFSSESLRNTSGNLIIPSGNITFVPSTIESIPSGAYRNVYAQINIPFGAYATSYSGLATARNNPVTTSDTVSIFVTVMPYYDLDISDNEQNLINNKMTLTGAMGSVQSGYFRMVNPNSLALNVDPDQYGNADFTSFTFRIDTLRHISTADVIDEMLTDVNTIIPPSAVLLTLPVGLASGASYNARAQVTIPMNTLAGTYRGVIRMTGMPGIPGTPTDSFTLEVVVSAIEDLDIAEASVSATGSQGTIVNTSLFHVYSTDMMNNPDPDGPGNTTLYGVNFTCTNLTSGNNIIPSANVQFVPTIIESLPSGTYRSVYAQVNIPFGTYATTYSGLVTARNNTMTTSDTVRIFVTVNSYYDLDISDNEQNLINNKMTLTGAMGSIQSGYFRMVNPNSSVLNVDPDQYGNADFTSFSFSIDTLRHISTADVIDEMLTDVNTIIPPSAVLLTLPAGLAFGALYNARAQVTIPMNTLAGTYRGVIRVTGIPGTPGTPTDSFTLEVVIGTVEDLDIDSMVVHTMGNQGTLVNTTPFRVYSTDEAHNPDPFDGPGNTTLYGVNFTCTNLTSSGGIIIPSANVQFVPATIESLPSGTSRSVYAQVNIPFGTYATGYSGLVTARNNMMTVSDTVRIFVIVLPYYDLDISDNEQNLVNNKMTLTGVMGSIQSGYFRMVNPNSTILNVDPDQYGNANFTNFTCTSTNLRYVSVTGEDIDTIIPASAVAITLPSGLASGASYNTQTQINIPMNTLAGTYRGIIRITGSPGVPGTPTDSFTLEVVVSAVEDLDIDSVAVHATGNCGTTVNTTPFRVYSTDATHNPDPDGPGNAVLYGINFVTQSLRIGNRIIDSTNIQFIPQTIETLFPGTFRSVAAQITIPGGCSVATYSGRVTARNNTNSTSDTVRIFLTILLSSIEEKELNTNLPLRFSLNNIQSNPFTSQVTLCYSLAADVIVAIEIFDASGKLVKRLIDEKMRAGSYTVTWDGTDYNQRKVEQGIYFCRFVTDEYQTTRKMLMLK